jgi:hypothetical protein
MTGREAIRAYWRNQVDVRVRDGRRFRLDGAFDLEFDPQTGLCRSLREWWHADRPF